MLEDLRNEAQSSYEEEQQQALLEEGDPNQPGAERPTDHPPFLGMTPFQRFVIALLIFLMVCALGAFVLIAFGKVILPI
jgi:hypothetical protein